MIITIVAIATIAQKFDWRMVSTILAFSYEFFSGGQNLLLCKFLLLFYCFRAKFQGGAKVFKGGKLPQGGAPCPPVGESQHMIVAMVAIAAVFKVECIKADDGYSVFTSVTDSISPNSESIRSPFKIACYLFVLYES